MRFNRRKLVRLGLCGIVAALLEWGGAALAIRLASSGRVFDSESIAALPRLRAGVVLGCRKTFSNGLSNLYFARRIVAAAELYKAGKVDCLIVSGDNHVKTYDEASDMKSSLVEAGVPEAQIVCDYAGFRTLDTVVRAKKVFGLDSFVVISQPDHVRRAVFTARGFGCDAYGYAAQDVNGRYSIKTTIREQLAKIAAVLDVILRRSPKFLGPREPLPGDKTLELPVAEHGDEFVGESSANGRIILELHLADAAGEMRPEPMVVAEGRTFTLRRDDSSWPHQDKWLWHRFCEAVRASNAADPHQDGPLCFIKADSRCTFRNVSDVFDLCSSAGAWKLSVVARRGDDDTKSVYFKLRRPCPCHAPEEDAHLFYDCPYDEDDESDGECDDQQSLGRLLTIEVGPRFEGESEGAILRLRRRTSLAELDSAFGEMAKDPAIAGKSVCMKCTENSPYSTFVKIMDILYKHGFKRIYVFTL